MLPDKEVRCPATGFAKSCRDIVGKYKCPKWVHLTGKDPQSSQQIDNWGCVDTFLPKLLIEVAQQCRQTGASVDRFNSDMVQRNTILSALQHRPPDGDPPKLIEG